MTFDDDFIQLRTKVGGTLRTRCKQLGVDWPPPAYLDLAGVIFKLTNFSKITDEDRAAMTHVCRGAEYKELDDGEAEKAFNEMKLALATTGDQSVNWP